MYLPDDFEHRDVDANIALIRSHPLGVLVSSSAEDVQANPLPFLVERNSAGAITLRAHMARANPQWKHLEAGATPLVIFQGPESYVTPSWYASKKEHGKVVPTWNYVMVQVRGTATIHVDANWLGQQISDLTGVHEQDRAEPWAVTDAPERYIDVQKRGIIGLEIAVTSITGKWKMSQNKVGADRAGVHGGALGEGKHDIAALVLNGGSESS